MRGSDHEEFKTLLATLCAAFDVPLTKVREDAFWGALAKMGLQAFRSCVEYAIGPDYAAEGFPTTGQIWRIYKSTAYASGPAGQKELPPDPDHLSYYANRLLWLHISHRGGLGSSDGKASGELERCLKFKRELVSEFCGFIRDGDPMATPSAFVTWWLVGLQKISEVLPRTQIDLKRLAEEPDAQVPFAEVAGRELAPVQEAFA